MMRTAARLVALLALVLAVALAALPAGAQESGISGPTLTLSETAVAPGAQITVIFTGFTGRLVTLSVCGNQAKRGSADCNMPASQGVRLYHVDDTPLTAFVVSTPPGTCPCVIRASSDTGELAYAPIEIQGVATGAVVDPYTDDAPLEMSISARPAPDGILATVRSWLGGATPYEVHVTVRNASTEQFSAVKVNGAVGRDAETDIDSFELEPGAMGAGQSWTGTTTVEVAAPVIGSFDVRAVASGAGPVTEASVGSRAVPWLLIVLVLVLVADLVAVVVRWAGRHRARRLAAGGDDGTHGLGGGGGGWVPGGPPPTPSAVPVDPVLPDDRVGVRA
jgi:hypothetical protein